MYHSPVSDRHDKTIGRAADCDLVLQDDTVSRLHAVVSATPEGYLALQDSGSRNGTFLHRRGTWIRVRRVILGADDRIRLGDRELPLERLVALFGSRREIRLREGYSARGKPLVLDRLLADLPKPKIILENPRRNPVTGDIEEGRK